MEHSRPTNTSFVPVLGHLSRALLCAAAVLAAGCTTKPDQLEPDPASYTFYGVGQDAWFKAVPRIAKGKRFTKMEADVVWESADASIVTVDVHGKAVSVGPGQTVLKASLGSLSYEVPVEVRVIGEVRLDVDSLTLTLTGDEDEIIRNGATVTGEVFDTLGRKIEGKQPAFSCKDENVCRTSNGQVVPVEAGETLLVARSEKAVKEIPVKVVSEVKKGGSRRKGARTVSF